MAAKNRDSPALYEVFGRQPNPSSSPSSPAVGSGSAGTETTQETAPASTTAGAASGGGAKTSGRSPGASSPPSAAPPQTRTHRSSVPLRHQPTSTPVGSPHRVTGLAAPGASDSSGAGVGAAPPVIASASSSGTPRTVRIPLGWAYFAVVIGLSLLIGSYLVGHSQGWSDHIESLKTENPSGIGSPANQSGTIDSSWFGKGNGTDSAHNQGNTGQAVLPPANPSGSGRTGTTATPSSSSGSQTASSAGLSGAKGPILDRDGRIRGLNYIVVERFEPDEAWAVKDFLEGKGIDVWVLPDNNNAALYQVVVSQGFDGWASNAQAQALYSRLAQLGKVWKNERGGSKDFSQRLAQKY